MLNLRGACVFPAAAIGRCLATVAAVEMWSPGWMGRCFRVLWEVKPSYYSKLGLPFTETKIFCYFLNSIFT